MTGYELGLEGERWVASLLTRAGLQVEMGGPADLICEGTPIEVKAARPSRRLAGRREVYQFSLRRTSRNGRVKTDARRAALVVLLCYYSDDHDPAAFIIPTDALGNRKVVKVSARYPWNYAGQWAGYLNAWRVLERVLGGER